MTKPAYKTCPHGKIPKRCKTCTPCPHGRLEYFCKECRPCPHKLLKQYCKNCTPCPHGNLRLNCMQCKYCKHGNKRNKCVECFVSLPYPDGKDSPPKDSPDACGSMCLPYPDQKDSPPKDPPDARESVCPLCGQPKEQCKLDHPCPHGLLKLFCKECLGCVHGRVIRYCLQCSSTTCVHGQITSYCRECMADIEQKNAGQQKSTCSRCGAVSIVLDTDEHVCLNCVISTMDWEDSSQEPHTMQCDRCMEVQPLSDFPGPDEPGPSGNVCKACLWMAGVFDHDDA